MGYSQTRNQQQGRYTFQKASRVRLSTSRQSWGCSKRIDTMPNYCSSIPISRWKSSTLRSNRVTPSSAKR